MNKEEIQKRILEIGEEDIDEFVNTRISELENNVEEKTTVKGAKICIGYWHAIWMELYTGTTRASLTGR